MTRATDKSRASHERAKRVLVGGVNSPVRAFAAVGGEPVVIASAKGAEITDVDGNTYVDYVASYGPTILGHAPDHVVAAVNEAVRAGSSFGAPTEAETQLAEAVVDAVASVEQVRFVSSGTEAVMSAIRLARGSTGRDKIIKCVGGYHGHCDALLVAAGSGATTLGVPSSPGVPAGAVADTLLAPYNDAGAIADLLDQHAGAVAAVIVEPVAGNMGVILPADGYLHALRELCSRDGALLIFDEVMTGFRLAYGGAQELYGAGPDITTLGKIIGGGMPVGAFAGPMDIMQKLAPAGDVYQAGTLSGNPAAMAAGLATLTTLRKEGFYERLEATSASLADGLQRAAAAAGVAESLQFNRVGSMLCVFFTPSEVTDYASATASNTRAYAAFFGAMLDEGVYLAPSQFEAMFVSAAHDDSHIARTCAAAERAFAAAKGFL